MANCTDDQNVVHGLKRIRRLRRTLVAIVISFPLLVYLLASLELPETTVILSGVAWVLLGIVVEFMIGFARCPGCRKYFHVRGMTGNFFTKKCLNCGAPLHS